MSMFLLVLEKMLAFQTFLSVYCTKYIILKTHDKECCGKAESSCDTLQDGLPILY